MNDIKQLIEEALEKWTFPEVIVNVKPYSRKVFSNGYEAGYNACLSSSRWRKVEEQLPYYAVPVLLKFVNKSYEVGYYLRHKYREDSFYSDIEPDIEFIFEAVTHWQPIND